MPDRPSQAERLTVLLQAHTQDASQQRSLAFAAVYQELRAIARRQMRSEAAHTLQATALVHEAWLRLFGTRQHFANEAEFLAAAANTMRRVLIDHARGRGRQKRGAGVRPIPLDAVELATRADADELLALDEAVAELERRDPRLAEQAKLRLFAGLDEAEVANALAIGERTARRDWVLIRAFLQRHLEAS